MDFPSRSVSTGRVCFQGDYLSSLTKARVASSSKCEIESPSFTRGTLLELIRIETYNVQCSVYRQHSLKIVQWSLYTVYNTLTTVKRSRHCALHSVPMRLFTFVFFQCNLEVITLQSGRYSTHRIDHYKISTLLHCLQCI